MKKLLMLGLVLVAGPLWAVTADDVDCVKCVDKSDIALEAVNSLRIKDGAVTTSKIKAGAVGTSRLRDLGVTTEKIEDGAVTVDKVSPELSNSIDTYCSLAEYVVGKDETGNYTCETIAGNSVDYGFFFDADDGLEDSYIEGSCDAGFIIDAIGCDCGAREEEYLTAIEDPSARNKGVLYSCQMTSEGSAEVGCYDFNYDAMLGPSEANLIIKCVAEPDYVDVSMKAAP